MNESAPENIEEDLRAANARRRVNPDAPPPRADTPPPMEMDDETLRAAILNPSTRKEVLADPAVKVRLARQDPEVRAALDELEAKVEAAEARAEEAVERAAGPRPTPLPGGNYASSGAVPITGDSWLREQVDFLRYGIAPRSGRRQPS
ncbi:MAG: hypothetical protein RL139_1120 [Gemmatimonadota bacterium]|jgi:hypothetical protein